MNMFSAAGRQVANKLPLDLWFPARLRRRFTRKCSPRSGTPGSNDAAPRIPSATTAGRVPHCQGLMEIQGPRCSLAQRQPREDGRTLERVGFRQRTTEKKGQCR